MGKRRLMAIMIVVMMVFAMMPKSAGTVYAEADITPPEFDLSTLKAEISSGTEIATVGDNVIISVKITDDTEVGYVEIMLNKPSGGVTGGQMNYNAESGCYEYVIPVTESTVPGKYTINQITARDTNDNPSYISFPSSGSFTIENPYADATPPEIDLSTLKAEISSGEEVAIIGDNVTISVKITDNIEVGYVEIMLNKPSGGIMGGQMDYNAERGCYEYVIPVAESTVPGKYTINQITARDTNDNPSYIHLPSSGSFTIENPYADATPPEIDLSTLKAEISSGEEVAIIGDNVTISVKITDNIEVGYVEIMLNKPSGGIMGGQMDYNAERGCYEYVIPVTESTVPGEYTINQITARDTNDNPTYLHQPLIGSFIISGTTSDDIPPVIDCESLESTLPEGRDFVVTGNSVKNSVSVSDEGLGVSRISIIYVLPISGDKKRYTLIYNSEIEKWERSIGFNKADERGIWKIYSIEALDRGGNLTRIISSEFDVDSDVDFSSYDFQLRSTISFDTRGGNWIEPQYIVSGEKAIRPDDPTKGGGSWQGGGDFIGWYADEDLTQEFNFNNPITEDATVYSKWAYAFSISSYDKTNSYDYSGGQYMVLQHGETENDMYYGGSNYTLFEGDELTLKAYPDKGYLFAGWYKGEYIGMVDDEHTQVSRPLDMSDPDNLLSSDIEYSFVVDSSVVICPVFEVCEDHQWGERIKKATPDEDGMIYGVCSVCGIEEAGIPLLKVSNIKLEADEFTYTGQEIKPEVTVANSEENLSEECYSVEYKNNIEPGTATAVVTLKGDYYEGTKELTFTIKAKEQDPPKEEPKEPGTEEPKEPMGPKAVTPKIELSAMTFTYNGKEQKPTVTVKDGDTVLKADTDYTVEYSGDCINAGIYTITVTLKGNYTGSAKAEFTINKAANPLKVNGKKVTLKLSTIKKKTKKLAVSKTIKFKKKGEGNITYSLSSAKKGKKNYKKKFKIDKKTGKLTVKKGLKKGAYKVKVKVKAAGNSNYNSLSRTATINITVK